MFPGGESTIKKYRERVLTLTEKSARSSVSVNAVLVSWECVIFAGGGVVWIGSYDLYFLCILSVSAIAQSQPPQHPSQIEREHTAWIAAALNSMQTIKVGMTRSDLVKMFTTEGGLSTTSQRTYVFRQCPYIKVDVKFAASSRAGELPTHKNVEVSRPYLAWSVMD
jgi:hypothetical protein